MLSVLLMLALGQHVTPAARPILPWRPLEARGEASVAWDFEALTTPAGTTTDIYTPFAAEFVGNWFYLRGDGTNQPGAALTLSAVGSPLANTILLNGDTLATTRYTNGGAWRAPADTLQPSEVSLGAFFTADTTGTSRMLVAKDAGGGVNENIYVFHDFSNARFIIRKPAGGASTSIQGASAFTARVPHFVVATYKFVSDGASLMALYVDGVQVAQSATAVGPINNTSSQWAVGNSGASQPLAGNVILGFKTDKVLSPATVAAMAQRLFPAPLREGSGRNLFFSRSGAASLASGTRVSWTPTNVPRVVGGAYLNEGAAVNLARDSDDLTTGSWTSTGVGAAAPTRTATNSLAPDGSKTFTRLQLAAVGEAQESTVAQSNTVSSGAQYTVSFWARATSSTGTLPWYESNHPLSLQLTALTTTPQRLALTFTTTGTSVAVVFGNAQASTGQTSAAADVEVWGVQLETGDTATSHVRTAGTSVTRNADDLRWYWSRTNHARFSQDVSGASWAGTNVALAAATADTLAPDGTQTAGKVTASAGAAAHYGSTSANASLTVGRRYVWSVHAKAGTARYLYLARTGVWQAAVFDLQAGALVAATEDANAGNATRWAPSNAFALDAGNGWWRVGFVGAAESTSDVVSVGPLPTGVSPVAGTAPTYAPAETAEALYVWGASLSGWDNVDTLALDGSYVATGAASAQAFALNRTAFAAKGEAQAEANAYRNDVSRVVGWDSSASHESLLFLPSATTWGALNGDGTSDATSAAVAQVLGRWTLGRAVWAPEGLTVYGDGAQGAKDASYTPWTTSAYVRLGNTSASKPLWGYLRNVRLRVAP